MTVGLVESVAIVTLNLCTIIVFMGNRKLRRRSTYLMINLAVTDFLVGGAGVYVLFYWFGVICEVWKGPLNEHLIEFIVTRLLIVFPGISVLNIAIIALERAYATFRPLRHRVLKKWVYGLIITCLWVCMASATSVSISYLSTSEDGGLDLYLKIVFCLFVLLIICVSYTSIVIKVRCGAQPQHHGAASRERKLTMTLLIVTVVSLVLYLPHVIINYVLLISKFEILQSFSFSVAYHLESAIYFLYFANSFVNPILYAMRMPEYRSALLALFRKRTRQQREDAVFNLRAM